MRTRRPSQRGMALVMALVLMVAVLLIGFASVRAALADGQSARHERDRQSALHAADAALLDAEYELAATAPSSPRFAALAGAGFSAGCGKAGSENQGLCTLLPASSSPSWQAIDLAGDDPALVLYGTYTLRTLAGVARAPRYLIELIPLDPAYGRFYRITALGFGQLASTRVVLQSFYRVAPAAGAGPPIAPAPPTGAAPVINLPDHRLGWREVANWPALHAAAIY